MSIFRVTISTVFLVICITTCTGFTVDYSVNSLYSPSDYVIDLVDANITDITSDDSIWLVEFYKHWCGHCQNFAPTWKETARALKDYSPHIKVGAINCASQSECQNYGIYQVPTVRLYNPRSPLQWKELSSSAGSFYFKNEAVNDLNIYYPEVRAPRSVMMDAPQPQPELPMIPLPTTQSPKEYKSKPDKVHQTDIETAIKYSLTNEIPMKSRLEINQLNALYQFLDVLVKYTPNLNENTRKFLISLREWPKALGLQTVSNQELKERIAELEDFYQPFRNSEEEYVYCKGSSPSKRGYPCSLWTLFHTLTANAALKEDSHMHSHRGSEAARAIFGYVQNFFSCGDCVRHFILAAGSISPPYTENDSVIWLWNLHNSANSRLSGDVTEDPQHPKIQWPSSQNCPQCSTFQGTIDSFGNYMMSNVWDLTQVKDYIKKVYSGENIEQSLESSDDQLSDDQRLKLSSTCQKALPSSIQQKCSPIFTYKPKCNKP